VQCTVCLLVCLFVHFQYIFIARDVQTAKHRYSHTQNYTYYYSFFIHRILCHVSSTQINICSSYPPHTQNAPSHTHSIFKMYFLISTGVSTCKVTTTRITTTTATTTTTGLRNGDKNTRTELRSGPAVKQLKTNPNPHIHISCHIFST